MSSRTIASAPRPSESNGRQDNLPDSRELLRLYEQMILLRQFELAAQVHFKKGEMPGFIHLYIGQEAVAVGICAHLRTDDWITSTHRGHGHALAKGMPPRDLMAELYAKATGCCGGRGGSMHLYDAKQGVFGTNGIVGAGIPHAVGAAISAKIRGTDGIAAAFFGDGGVNHGAFHESLNFAGVRHAGVLFVCENNLYATATPLRVATLNTDISTKAAAYGIPGVVVDGNDVLAVWKVARDAVARARRGEGPTLIEARTYRTVGHNEGEPLTGTYRTQEELDQWKERCPVATYRKLLLDDLKAAKPSDLEEIEARVKKVVDEAVDFARKSPLADPATFFANSWAEEIHPALPEPASSPKMAVQGWMDAVREGISEEMRHNPHIIYFGEGTGERGGSFAHTKGMWHEFGGARMVDTPICELGFTGAAIGASATGCRTIADLMFADFLFETGGQIPLQASKLRYMSNGQMTCPVVIRAPCGAIKSAGPHHSGTYHSVWSHLPGLIVVMPSNPADAKGLIKTALRSNDPVLFLEPKGLFASKGEVPEGEYFIPFGVARIARQGKDLTIVATGRMVQMTLDSAEILEKSGVSCEVIDLRTIVPLDLESISTSLAKTGRLLIVDEGYAMCGLGAEIAAAMGEHSFDALDAPVGRLCMEPTAHPFSPALEGAMLPSVEKIVAAANNVMEGLAPVQRRLKKRPTRTSSSTPPVVQAPSSPVDLPKTEVIKSEVAVMAGEPLQMPHGDLTVSEAVVVTWLKKIGDTVKEGEGVVEVETDKAVMPIEASKAGRLIQIIAPVGQTVKMGETLGILGDL